MVQWIVRKSPELELQVRFLSRFTPTLLQQGFLLGSDENYDLEVTELLCRMSIFGYAKFFTPSPLLFSTPIWAQFEWTELTQEAGTRRFDDVFFLTNQKGWAVNSSVDFRKVFYTSDGGSSWQVLRGWTGTQMPYVRSIQFFNDSVGLMGTLGGGLYRSTNGGQLWDSIQAAMSPRPVAICGMYRVNDSVLYAVGDYASTARMYKTRDRGLTWTFIDVGNTASNLIDVYFTDEQHGFAIGRAANPVDGCRFCRRGGNSWSLKI